MIEISSLEHTWILDLDGTLVKHNGYLDNGYDSLLEGAKGFIDSIPPEDFIIILTSRRSEYSELTEKFLLENKIRYTCILYNVPYGERILINDRKPSGLATAVAVNIERDDLNDLQVKINKKL